jgi:formylglycine-generating enzyme required for sulfatase activity
MWYIDQAIQLASVGEGAVSSTISAICADEAGSTATNSVLVYYIPPTPSPPTVSISTPTNGQTFTTSPVTVSGTATEQDLQDIISLVQVQMNGTAGAWQTASGATNWSASVPLSPGTNTIYARSEDGTGLYSTNASVKVAYNPPIIPPILLGIAEQNSNLVFTWPTNEFGFVLQSSPNLGAAAVWSTNLPSPVFAGGQNVVTNPISGSRMFFRLNLNPPPLVLIPAGSFTMGDVADTNIDGDAAPTNVYVSAFYLDQYDVTYPQWQRVYNWAVTHGYSFDNPGSGKAANQPVQTISWYDCVKWCNARSEMEGRAPAYYTNTTQSAVYRTGDIDLGNACVNWAAGYRLPTEAEWEKAARGGLSGQRFPWGETISWSQANYYGYPLALTSYGFAYDLSTAIDYDPAFSGRDSGDYPYTSPVGSFAPNGYGLYDMAGNVRQFCWDWFGPYAGGTDPRGPTSGSRRVDRGGSWYDDAYTCRSAFRDNQVPGPDGVNGFGFRSVLSATQ